MNKTTKIVHLAIFLFFSTNLLFSQEKSVLDWQKANPNVLLIEYDNFISNSNYLLENENISFLVYHKELTIEDIEKFEKNSYLAHGLEIEEDTYEIKNWLHAHRDVKILTTEEFQNLNSLDKEKCIKECLVLNSNKITLKDIQNFETK